ncbi:hypothetical protein [Pseudomonas sp. PB3P13]
MEESSEASHHMHMSEAYQIMEALSTNDANMKIREGWKLLSVVVTTHPNGHLHPAIYWLKGSLTIRSLQQTDTFEWCEALSPRSTLSFLRINPLTAFLEAGETLITPWEFVIKNFSGGLWSIPNHKPEPAS